MDLSSRALLSVFACLLSACGPVMALGQNLREMRAMWTLRGEVRVEGWSGAPIVAMVLRAPPDEGAQYEIVDYERLERPGPYRFLVEAGTFRVVAFEDANADLHYQPGERIGAYRGYLDVEVDRARASLDIVVRDLESRAARAIARAAPATPEARSLHIGEVRPLSAPRFSAAVGRMGMWEPLDFMREHGAGLFFLEPYDPSRVPVVFVHGAAGYPREFAFFIERLDRRRFQPWVVQYPSGWDLAEVADYFDRAMTEVRVRLRFDRLCLVAHSAGGLVARRMLERHAARRMTPGVRSFVSIASPLGGMASAGVGVTASPLVVPAWRSLDPGGDLVRHLYDHPLPEAMRYALLFTYEDEVVPLSSQLRADAQSEADLVRGLHGSHAGVLRSEHAATVLNEELGRCYDGFARANESAISP